MAAYAQGTRISVSKTVNDILAVLVKHGIDDFGQVNGKQGAAIMFRFEGINYKVELPYPDPNDWQITHTPNSEKLRSKVQQEAFYQKEVDRRMRAMLLVIKAKLVAVSEGIVSFESEFLSYAVLGDGRTMMEHAQPAIEAAKSGAPITLALPGGDSD